MDGESADPEIVTRQYWETLAWIERIEELATGPIDRNLGFDASLFQINTTSISGSNALAITTGSDLMGWMIAAASVDVPPVGVSPQAWGAVRELYR